MTEDSRLMTEIHPSHLRRLHAADQVFFHIVDRCRHVDRQQPRALTGFDRAVVRLESERARAFACRAL